MTREELRVAEGPEVVTEKIIGQKAYDLLAKEVFTAIKGKANKVHRHSADDIDDSVTKKIPTIAKQSEWDAKVTNEQLQEAVKQFASGLAWKGVFNTLEEAKGKITEPKEGDFIIVVQDPKYGNKNTILIYEKDQVNDWQTAGELFTPGKATQDVDGLMSKEDKKKLDDITDEKLVSTEEKQKWNEAHTKATANEQALKTKADKTTAITVGNGLEGGGDLSTSRNINLKLDGDSLGVSAKGLKANIIDSLDSVSVTQGLSANQGKILKGLVDGKVDSARNVTAGNGLEGGGALSTDITLTVKAENESITVGAGGIKVAVVDGLGDVSTIKPLSANQGKVLNEKIQVTDAKADKNAKELADKMTEVEAKAIIEKYKEVVG